MSKRPSYKLEYSKSVSDEDLRLKSGNDSQKLRAKKLLVAAAAILADPLHDLFKKDLPDNYKAAKVLDQYRVFFKIYNQDPDNVVIFLVWMNDENYIHTTRARVDPAYERFRELHATGDLEQYVTPALPSEARFNQNGNWGDNAIYFGLEQAAQDQVMCAHSNLYLSKIKNNEYRIDTVWVSHPNEKLAKTLLLHICETASIGKITLYYELDTKKPDLKKNRHLLNTCGFTPIETIEQDEIWQKTP